MKIFVFALLALVGQFSFGSLDHCRRALLAAEIEVDRVDQKTLDALENIRGLDLTAKVGWPQINSLIKKDFFLNARLRAGGREQLAHWLQSSRYRSRKASHIIGRYFHRILTSRNLIIAKAKNRFETRFSHLDAAAVSAAFYYLENSVLADAEFENNAIDFYQRWAARNEKLSFTQEMVFKFLAELNTEAQLAPLGWVLNASVLRPVKIRPTLSDEWREQSYAKVHEAIDIFLKSLPGTDDESRDYIANLILNSILPASEFLENPTAYLLKFNARVGKDLNLIAIRNFFKGLQRTDKLDEFVAQVKASQLKSHHPEKIFSL